MTVSQAALQQMLAENTGAVLLDLLTVDHSSMSSPERFVRDVVSLTYGGNTYNPASFSITQPEDSETNTQPRAKLRLDNVDRRLIATIRSVSDSPEFTLETVLELADGTIQPVIAARTYETAEFTYDQHVIEGQLGYEDLLNMPATKDRFDPVTAPGLFS